MIGNRELTSRYYQGHTVHAVCERGDLNLISLKPILVHQPANVAGYVLGVGLPVNPSASVRFRQDVRTDYLIVKES